MSSLGFQDITHPDDLQADLHDVEALIAGSISTYSIEKRYLRKDGAVMWANLAMSLLRDEAEEKLWQSQKMEAVGQLAGGLVHNFNNLLTGITGSLELMQTRIAQGRVTDLDRYINAAQGAAKRAAALTHRLLAFSRRQTLDPKPTRGNRLETSLDEFIRRTVGPAVTVEVVTLAGLWSTSVDPNQIENALLNLCLNARDAMPDGERLTIETGNRWLDERGAAERDLTPGQDVSLCVSDTGTGMPADVFTGSPVSPADGCESTPSRVKGRWSASTYLGTWVMTMSERSRCRPPP